MIYLLNSAVMTTPDLTYRPRAISEDEFVSRYLQAVYEQRLRSYIGYPATAQHIEKVSGVRPNVTRDPMPTLKAGDTLLICKLHYRLPDPRAKSDARFQQGLKGDDYEYWLVAVSEF